MSTSYASRRRSQGVGRWLPWLAGLVLVAGVLAALIAFLGNTAHPNNPVVSNRPAVVPTKPKTVPLPRDARRVAGEFILTAVGRQNLPRAWALSAPAVRGGMTYAEWLTGNIPVVPYPAKAIKIAPIQIVYSYPGRALLQVFLVPKKGAGVKPALFLLGVKRYGEGKSGHWLVSYWAPRAAPEIPLNTARG